MMLGILWMFQVIAFILVGLRLYTRLVVMHNYGIDDHCFNFSVVSTFPPILSKYCSQQARLLTFTH